MGVVAVRGNDGRITYLVVNTGSTSRETVLKFLADNHVPVTPEILRQLPNG